MVDLIATSTESVRSPEVAIKVTIGFIMGLLYVAEAEEVLSAIVIDVTVLPSASEKLPPASLSR